jgi:hypothetical protein
MSVSKKNCRVTPPLRARAPAYDGEYYTSTLRLALWHAFRHHTRGPKPSPVSQSPIRSLEVSGSQTDLLTPGTKGGPRSSLSDIRRFSLEGMGRRTYDETRVTCHPREKNYGDRTPPGLCVPHGRTPVALQCPLPSQGDALFSEQGPGIVVVVSCTKLPQLRVYLCQPTM